MHPRTTKPLILAAVTTIIVIAGCGRAGSGAIHSGMGSASPQPSAVSSRSPCMEGPLPPAANRLTQTRSYDSSNIRLTPVEATVTPKVSAAEAYANLQYHHDASGCGLEETLAYWSSNTPAVMPPECECCIPSPRQWSPPPDCSAKPLFQHLLAWVFIWRSDCFSTGGGPPLPGSSPRPQPPTAPLACVGITFVDATSGKRSDFTSFFGPIS